MPADLGTSFSPASQQQDAQTNALKRRRLPVQQALQTLSLQLPQQQASAQGGAISNDLLSGHTGGVRGGPGQSYTQALLSALTSGGTSMASARGGNSQSGWRGGGFGSMGQMGQTPLPGSGGAPRPSGPRLPSGATPPPGRTGPLPGPLPPQPGPSAGGGVQARPPGQRPPTFEVPEFGEPGYVNPNVPGGGVVDPFGGRNTPTFTTPTGGVGGATSPTPAPPPQPYNPYANGGSYTGTSPAPYYASPYAYNPYGTAGRQGP